MKKPFKTYNGGKAGNGTYQQIINQIPKHRIYVEPMVGNGGVLHNLKLPSITVINDLDGSVIEKYDETLFATDLVKSNYSYEVITNVFDRQKDVFFYFDPPYLFSTRKSKKPLYNYEWTEADHVEFLTLANSIKSNCMISHYPCELYDTMLAGWRTHDFQSMTRNGLRTERIYMNYPEPEILQDYRYTGTDYRERQRIKRKVTRHISKLEALPNDERNAILSAVMDKYGATAVTLNPGNNIKNGCEITAPKLTMIDHDK
ncbi:DNA adenine methylase [Nubsella zeaxanthinifaciens]|uniref:DNA adenine methylase n=1 Tax=Nubsella zeaxanthinifaciens TaxID=392412 RepID=UPI000DE4CAE3|nr:DNA adenine methylase [Nubsella zeaxanthinifaciens]